MKLADALAASWDPRRAGWIGASRDALRAHTRDFRDRQTRLILNLLTDRPRTIPDVLRALYARARRHGLRAVTLGHFREVTKVLAGDGRLKRVRRGRSVYLTRGVA